MTTLRVLSAVAPSARCLAARTVSFQPARRPRSYHTLRVSATTMAPQQPEVVGPANPAMRPRKVVREDPESGTVLGKLGGATAVQVG